MTFNEKSVRALVAEEAEKQPLRVKLIRDKPSTGEVWAMGVLNMLLAGLLLMWGMRAAHNLFPGVPAGGYVDTVFVILGCNAIGAAFGWTPVGVIK